MRQGPLKGATARLLLAIALCLFAFGCSGTAAAVPPLAAPLASDAELDALTIPALPGWVDKYAETNKGDMRYFNISEVMKRCELGRYAAVELQNHYRDLSRATPEEAPLARFNKALKKIQAGEFESKLDLARLDKADFIVVLDLDETLYDQYYKAGADCSDAAFEVKGKPKHLKFVPGWRALIERVNALGGAVVIFSANVDDTNYQNLANWDFDGKPLYESPLVAGFFTNSHLVLQEKTEGPGEKSARKGRPVREPSKDLRLFDATLKKVIIVDDNPTRLFQFRNTRVFKKFDADLYCETQNAELKKAFDLAMPAVVKEIEESVEYMKANPGVDFVTAYLPYSSLGQITVQFLVSSNGWTPEASRAYVRTHPDIVDRKF